jgi:hypothetical protein
MINNFRLLMIFYIQEGEKIKEPIHEKKKKQNDSNRSENKANETRRVKYNKSWFRSPSSE